MPSKYGLLYSWSMTSEVIHFKTKTINCYLSLQNDVLMLTLGCRCGLLWFFYLNLTSYWDMASAWSDVEFENKGYLAPRIWSPNAPLALKGSLLQCYLGEKLYERINDSCKNWIFTEYCMQTGGQHKCFKHMQKLHFNIQNNCWWLWATAKELRQSHQGHAKFQETRMPAADRSLLCSLCFLHTPS